MDYPMIMNTQMVRAYQDGRKTMTRRLVKPQPEYDIQLCPWSGTGWALGMKGGGCSCVPVKCPCGPPGDRLGIIQDSRLVRFLRCIPWLWSIVWHWFVIAWTEITEIRVERLQDITEEDAIREGIPSGANAIFPRLSFARLIDTIYPGSWERNEWVWVIGFRGCE